MTDFAESNSAFLQILADEQVEKVCAAIEAEKEAARGGAESKSSS